MSQQHLALPLSAYNLHEWPEFCLQLLFRPNTHPIPVGTAPQGVRWHRGPLYVEEYRSDTEPQLIDTDAPHRVVVWRRLTKSGPVPGWWQWSNKPEITIGFHVLNEEPYWHQWKKTARYYRKQWLEKYANKQYVIKRISLDDFCVAYARSTVAEEIPTLEIERLKERMAHSASSPLWGVIRLSDHQVVAGLAAIDSVENFGSYYSSGFYHASVRNDPVMTGLIDHWFLESAQRGIRILHLGIFLKKEGGGTERGDSISLFKSRFVTDYLTYQAPLLRLAWGTRRRK